MVHPFSGVCRFSPVYRDGLDPEGSRRDARNLGHRVSAVLRRRAQEAAAQIGDDTPEPVSLITYEPPTAEQRSYMEALRTMSPDSDWVLSTAEVAGIFPVFSLEEATHHGFHIMNV